MPLHWVWDLKSTTRRLGYASLVASGRRTLKIGGLRLHWNQRFGQRQRR